METQPRTIKAYRQLKKNKDTIGKEMPFSKIDLDQHGNVLSKIIYDETGEIAEETHCAYDPAGDLLEESYRNSAEGQTERGVVNYEDNKSRITEITYFSEDAFSKVVTLYHDRDKDMIARIERFEDGTTMDESEEFAYNEKNQLIRHITRGLDDVIIKQIDYGYDDSGKKISEMHYENDELVDDIHFQYDDAHRVIARVYQSEGYQDVAESFEYDSQGMCVSATTRVENDIIRIHSFMYDTRKNCIHEKFQDYQNDRVYVIERAYDIKDQLIKEEFMSNFAEENILRYEIEYY